MEYISKTNALLSSPTTSDKWKKKSKQDRFKLISPDGKEITSSSKDLTKNIIKTRALNSWINFSDYSNNLIFY